MTTPNPQVPDPNAVAGYNPQQVPGPQQVPAPPQVQYAPAEAMQPDMQQSWGQMPADAGMQAGFAQAGPAAYGPAVSARSHRSYMPAGILFGIGLLLTIVPFIATLFLGRATNGFQHNSDTLFSFLGQLFYALPIGIILILVSGIVAILVAVMNSSSKS